MKTSSFIRISLELSRLQSGIVARQQLLAAGIAAPTIANAVAGERLFTVFPGVYLFGSPRLSRDGLMKASLLAAGDGAVIGGRTAAALWGFLDHRNPIDVIRTRRGRKQTARLPLEGERWLPKLVIHSSRSLSRADVTMKRGLSLTTPARTLRDSVVLLEKERFKWSFLEADRLRLLNDKYLRRLADRMNGLRGGGLFKEMVRRRIPNIREARSLLEAIVLDLVRSSQIPAPEINRRTHAYRPDFRWRAEGVLVEADGYEFHQGREAFENDILRANRLRAEGWTVLRFTWRMVTERPAEVAAMILQTLKGSAPE